MQYDVITLTWNIFFGGGGGRGGAVCYYYTQRGNVFAWK